MEEKVKYTKEGYQKLLDELDYAKSVERPRVLELLKEARAYGDLSENSEYDEARDQQAKLEVKIAQLELQVKNAIVLTDEEAADTSAASLGTSVKLQYENKKVEEYHITNNNEINPFEHKISARSAIAMAIIGHGVGEEVVVHTASGDKKVKIVSIEKTK